MHNTAGQRDSAESPVYKSGPRPVCRQYGMVRTVFMNRPICVKFKFRSFTDQFPAVFRRPWDRILSKVDIIDFVIRVFKIAILDQFRINSSIPGIIDILVENADQVTADFTRGSRINLPCTGYGDQISKAGGIIPHQFLFPMPAKTVQFTLRNHRLQLLPGNINYDSAKDPIIQPDLLSRITILSACFRPEKAKPVVCACLPACSIFFQKMHDESVCRRFDNRINASSTAGVQNPLTVPMGKIVRRKMDDRSFVFSGLGDTMPDPIRSTE